MVLQTLYAPVQGNVRAKKWEWVGGRVGDFWDSIGNVNEINTQFEKKGKKSHSQSAIGWNTGPPMEELERVPKELKGSATL